MSKASFCFSLAATTLLLFPVASLASSDIPGPCSERLQALGYRRVHFEAAQQHSSLYDALRGEDEVKLMVHNERCLVQQVWLDD